MPRPASHEQKFQVETWLQMEILSKEIWPGRGVSEIDTLRRTVLRSSHAPCFREEKQHKHKLFGPDFPRTFLTLTPRRPWVKKFLPVTGAAEKRTFWCGRPRFLARTSMTRRVFEKLCTKKVCVVFLAPIVTSQICSFSVEFLQQYAY